MHPALSAALASLAALVLAALVAWPFASELSVLRSQTQIQSLRLYKLQAETVALRHQVTSLAERGSSCNRDRDRERRHRATMGQLFVSLTNNTVPTKRHVLTAQRLKELRARNLKRKALKASKGGRGAVRKKTP